MILVCYDGSLDAQAAIDRAAELMPGAETTVLTVWEPFVDTMVRTGSMAMGFGTAGMYANDPDIDETSRRRARQTATEGAERATAAGLAAEPRIAARHAGIAFTVLAVAGELDADLLVIGTRGLSGVKSFLLGSVSHEVLQHADRAVLVAPSAVLSARRHGWVERVVEPAAVEA